MGKIFPIQFLGSAVDEFSVKLCTYFYLFVYQILSAFYKENRVNGIIVTDVDIASKNFKWPKVVRKTPNLFFKI